MPDIVVPVREVEWIEEGPLGSGETHTSGPVTELLVGGPYPSLSPPEVPTLAIVNEMLSQPGGGGMNGGRRWRPFTLSANEYGDLVDDLVASHGFTVVDVPPWVTSHDEWHVWIMERRHGIPALSQRRLNQRAQELTKQFQDAKADPGTPADQLAVLYLAAERAKDDATHFADPWITAPRFTKYRRTMRWLLDAKHRQRAAEMAGDMTGAAAAAAEARALQERGRTARPDDAWPADWEDWPGYPPQEERNTSPGA
jgi:hypothetical protein